MSDLAIGIFVGMLIGAPFSMGALLLVQAHNIKKVSGPAPKLQPDPLPSSPPFRPWKDIKATWREPGRDGLWRTETRTIDIPLVPGVKVTARPDGTVSYQRDALNELAPKMARDDEPTATFVVQGEGSARKAPNEFAVPSKRYEVAS